MKAEAIMDLSNYGKTKEMRRRILDMSPAMLGTVPIYDAIGYCEKKLKDITKEDFMRVVRQHAEDGVDFMTIHAGINRATAQKIKDNKRRTNIVSRGGALLFAWMEMTGNENPFYEYYDEVMDIFAEYDVTISLGDACRPGCIDDATDAAQVKSSSLIKIVTSLAYLVRKTLSSAAAKPPPITNTFFPVKNSPSQVAQYATPCPRNSLSPSNPASRGWAPAA